MFADISGLLLYCFFKVLVCRQHIEEAFEEGDYLRYEGRADFGRDFFGCLNGFTC